MLNLSIPMGYGVRCGSRRNNCPPPVVETYNRQSPHHLYPPESPRMPPARSPAFIAYKNIMGGNTCRGQCLYLSGDKMAHIPAFCWFRFGGAFSSCCIAPPIPSSALSRSWRWLWSHFPSTALIIPVCLTDEHLASCMCCAAFSRPGQLYTTAYRGNLSVV